MPNAGPDRVRFGLVGYGAWGAYHAGAIREEAQLVAVCAATEQTRRRAAAELGPAVAIHASYEELVARDDLDVVDVVVPNFLHRAVATAALGAGKHVLLEKPVATTLEDCAAIAAAARQQRRLLAIGHEARLSPQWGKIKELIEAGAIGRPATAAIHLSRFPYRQGADGWRYDRARVGDWTLEESIHYFDLLRWYLSGLGEPQAVYACANHSAPGAEQPGLYNNLAALVSFPGGGFAQVSQTLAGHGYQLHSEVVGSGGAIRAHWLGESDRTGQPSFALEYFDGKAAQEIPLEGTPGERFELRTEIRQMAQSVATGAAPLVSVEDGTWAVRKCLAAEESARRGIPISLVAA